MSKFKLTLQPLAQATREDQIRHTAHEIADEIDRICNFKNTVYTRLSYLKELAKNLREY